MRRSFLRRAQSPAVFVGFVTLTSFVFMASCGKKKSSGSDHSSVAAGQLAVSFAAVNTSSGRVGFGLTAFAAEPAKPKSIASGAPDSFEVNILSMDLMGKDATGGVAMVNIFKNDAGKPIKITGSEIDLSQLFTTYECYKKDGTPLTLATGETCKCGVDKDDKLIAPQADGTCKQTNDKGELIEITEPNGILDVSALTYSELKVTFAPKAKIKGCVEATFSNQPDQVANGSSGYQKYCTQAALSAVNESMTPAHTEFKKDAAEETEIYLSRNWEYRTQNLQVSFPIKDGLTVAAGQKSNLTMVIDVNRMLRFYNKGEKDKGPNPGFPTNRAYFFSTVFEDSLFVFAGKAGSIRGYSWQANACRGTFNNIFTCNNSTLVDGWLTLILDANGTPFVANAMPDDDNNLTTLKGGNRKSGVGVDGSMITKNSDGSYNIGVSLNSTVDPTMYNFDLSKALGASFTTDYRGFSGDFGSNGVQDTYGKITFTRGL